MTLNRDMFVQLFIRLSVKKRFDKLKKEESNTSTRMLELLMEKWEK